MEPSVVTSEVYNEAKNVFNNLQNKENLISFLDCAVLLRCMGMNPTHVDLDILKSRMSQPILRLEQWRREEELKREKERRKEEKRLRKGNIKIKLSADRTRKSASSERRKTVLEKVVEESEKPVKIVPEEEIKNIDWNIFITCAKEIFRDSSAEEKILLHALSTYYQNDYEEQEEYLKKSDEVAVFDAISRNQNEESQTSTPFQLRCQEYKERCKIVNGIKTTEQLIDVVTNNGESVLTPSEIKLLRKLLPSEWRNDEELAARLQGTYQALTAEEEHQRNAVQVAITTAQRRWKGDIERANVDVSIDDNDSSNLLASMHV